MTESSLDAMELSAAALIIVNLPENVPDLQSAQLALVCFAVLNIIALDFFCVFNLNKENADLQYIFNFRHTHSIFTLAIIIPVTGIEIKLYLDTLATTDLICIVVLAIDLGYRLKGGIEFMLHGNLEENPQTAPAVHTAEHDQKTNAEPDQKPTTPADMP